MSTNTALSIFSADQAAFDSEKLRNHAFAPDMDADDERMGWVGFGQMLDYSQFDFTTPLSGYVAFSFRLDVRRPQSAAVRLKLAEAVQKEEAEKGHVLSKARKKELKEEIVAALTRKAEFTPSLIDLIWDLERSRVYVSSQSAKVLERIAALFATTFDTKLTELVPNTDMSKLLLTIHRESIQHAGYTLSSLGSGSLVTEDQQEHAQVTVQNDPNVMGDALNKGFVPNKLHILAVQDDDAEQQFDFELSNTLAISKLRLPKPEKDADQESVFLINADICRRVAELVTTLGE